MSFVAWEEPAWSEQRAQAAGYLHSSRLVRSERARLLRRPGLGLPRDDAAGDTRASRGFSSGGGSHTS